MGVFCDMQLENPNLVYQPGDVVSGRITLTLDERELIKALAIKISGFALTRWEKPIKERKQKKQKDEVELASQNKPREVYTNREDYLATTNYFIGSDEANAKIIEAGIYHYNFAVRLPLNCPSIFECTYGHIRYELNVFIDYPEYRQSCYLRNIHINRPFDLHSIPNLNQPLMVEVIEKKSFSKFWQRPLQLQVDIPRTGFIPGESLSVHLKVLNYDLLTLTGITYKLNLVATLIGMHKNKAKMHITRTNMLTMVHSLFGQNGNVVQHLQHMQIPVTPPTMGITECRCIQISYEIEVEVTTSIKNRGISAILPITIGTISIANGYEARLKGSAPALAAAHSMDNLIKAQAAENDAFAIATAPLEERTESQNTPRNNLAPKTSFREATFMSASNLKSRRKYSKSVEQLDNFTPKYLYYDMQNATMPIEETVANNADNSNEKTRF